MRTINKIIVHCSATPQFKEFSASHIKDWHVNGNGWSDIGYHYVVKLDGTIEVGRLLKTIGAHSKGNNKDSIGVCYIGGKDTFMEEWVDTRTKEQKESLIILLKYLKKVFSNAEIFGHRDFSEKLCPSFNAKKEYKNLT